MRVKALKVRNIMAMGVAHRNGG